MSSTFTKSVNDAPDLCVEQMNSSGLGRPQLLFAAKSLILHSKSATAIRGSAPFREQSNPQ